MKETFTTERFARHLLAEALFYDEEYGAVGTVSLVDPDAEREHYIAFFFPEEGAFVIEEATTWEEERDDDEVGYALATGSGEHGRYGLPEKAAEALLELAQEHGLLPSLALLFEDEAV